MSPYQQENISHRVKQATQQHSMGMLSHALAWFRTLCTVFDRAQCKCLDRFLAAMSLLCLFNPSQSGQNVFPSSAKEWCTDPDTLATSSTALGSLVGFWLDTRTRSDYSPLRTCFGTIRSSWLVSRGIVAHTRA